MKHIGISWFFCGDLVFYFVPKAAVSFRGTSVSLRPDLFSLRALHAAHNLNSFDLKITRNGFYIFFNSAAMDHQAVGFVWAKLIDR